MPTPPTTSHAPSGYRCPFCAIAAGIDGDHIETNQADVVLRAPEVTAFVSSGQWPNNPGHVLVVPNEHFENLYSLPLRLATPIHEVVHEVALALREAFACPGISTRQHNEPAGGQDVWHYHVHVFPRFEDDHLYGSARAPAAPSERAAQAAAIRAALDP